MNNNLLQHKLRMLLGSEVGKERNGGGGTLRRHELSDGSAELLPTDYGEDDAGQAGALRIPPPLYMPAHGFGRDGEEPLVLTENYRPISPPAEYAAKSGQAHNDRYRFVKRSLYIEFR